MIYIINMSGHENISVPMLRLSDKLADYFDHEEMFVVEVSFNGWESVNHRQFKRYVEGLLQEGYEKVVKATQTRGVDLGLSCGGLVLIVPDIEGLSGELAKQFLGRFKYVKSDKLVVRLGGL